MLIILRRLSNGYRISKNRLSTRLQNVKYRNIVYSSSLLATGYVAFCLEKPIEQREPATRLPGNEQSWKEWLWEQYEEIVRHNSVARFGRAAVAVVSVFVDYKYTLYGITSDHPDYWMLKSQCHLRSAIRFRDLCSINGGVFMKIGQHIGSLEFLFPKEYTKTLKCFQYDAPPSSISDVRSVIEHDLNCKMEDIFLEFDERPLGSASLAQVHWAVLKDGRQVAVKVQHKLVKKHAFADAVVIEFFVSIASKLFREFQFQWLVDSIKTNLPLEVDFLNEGRNCEKMGRMLKHFKYLKVPGIDWAHSTDRVLFMEFCEGGIVDDLEYIKKHDIDPNDISRKLGRLYSEMIFVNGWIHCDPHPGNILIRRSNDKDRQCDLILLDHGLYQQLNDSVRVHYCKLWQSLIAADIEGIKEHSKSLGVGDYYGLLACIVAARSWDAIQGGIDKSDITHKEAMEIQSTAVQLVPLITEVLERLPRDMILLFKTNDLLRGLDARLKTKATSASFITMSQCCLRAVYNEEIRSCNDRLQKLKLFYNYKINSLRILLYQLWSNPTISGFFRFFWKMKTGIRNLFI